MNPEINVLLVDADTAFADSLVAYLARFGFRAFPASDASEMQKILHQHPIDLVLLDPTLPSIQGWPLAQVLRDASGVPVVMLSARCAPADRIVGLDQGADDFIGKPCDSRELVARMRTVLRRSAAAHPAAAGEGKFVRFGGWTLDRAQRSLQSLQGSVVPLSNAEYQLLHVLLRSHGRVVSRDQLMEQARGRASAPAGRSIDLLVSRLRQKLAFGSAAGTLIRTVHGAGYRLDAKVEAPAPA